MVWYKWKTLGTYKNNLLQQQQRKKKLNIKKMLTETKIHTKENNQESCGLSCACYICVLMLIKIFPLRPNENKYENSLYIVQCTYTVKFVNQNIYNLYDVIGYFSSTLCCNYWEIL